MSASDRMPFSPANLELRLVVARALALEHGVGLGFHEEEVQLDFDRKAMAVLCELAELLGGAS